MRIELPPHFLHAEDLPAWYDSRDPRDGRFAESEVVLDLSKCEFVRAAAVLWCLVYPFLAKQRG